MGKILFTISCLPFLTPLTNSKPIMTSTNFWQFATGSRQYLQEPPEATRTRQIVLANSGGGTHSRLRVCRFQGPKKTLENLGSDWRFTGVLCRPESATGTSAKILNIQWNRILGITRKWQDLLTSRKERQAKVATYVSSVIRSWNVLSHSDHKIRHGRYSLLRHHTDSSAIKS